jgi:uncharacterized protein
MRKRLLSVLILVLLSAVLTLGSALAADGSDAGKTSESDSSGTAPLSENGKYYVFGRVVDLSETLEKEDRNELSHYIFDFMNATGCDIQIYIIPSVEQVGYTTMDEFTDASYFDEEYPPGYADTGADIILVYETEKEEAYVTFYGGDNPFSPWCILKARLFFEYYYRVGNPYDGCMGFIDRLWTEIDKNHEATELRTDMMNATYFKPYNNDHIARVLDYSNLISQKGEEKMTGQIAAIREKYGIDVVILTAPDSDGKDSEAFNDDFYDYVGFGVGPDNDGIILFVNMDPNVRYYTISTCGLGQDYFNEYVEDIYDAMFDSFKSGDYEQGIQIYLSEVEKLINKSVPVEEFNGVKRDDIKKADDDDDRVIDDAGVLSDSKKKELEKTIREIRKNYDMDVLVLIPEDTPEFYPEDYLRYYYEFMGYGVGKSASGIGIVLDPNSSTRNSIQVFGNASELFDSAAQSRLNSMVQSAIGSKNNRAKGAQTFVKKVRFRAKWKHYPMTTVGTIFMVCVVFIVMSIIGLVKKGSNKTVATADSATGYLVPGSCKVFRVNDRFLNTKVTKSRKPEPSSSSSRSGGGGSHYSSSGRSHGGGGGRHF